MCCKCFGPIHIVLFLQETFFYSLSYPVFLGFLICVLSLLSLKWGSNSGATWNLLALVGTFATWAAAAVVVENGVWPRLNPTYLYLVSSNWLM